MKLINADALHDDLRAKKKWIIKRKGKFNVGYTYDQVHFAIDDQTTVEAIPIEWIKEWIEEHHEYASRVTITWLLDDWKEEQEKQNESD